MSATSLWGQLKTAAAAGVLFGGYPFARKVYFVGDNAPQFGQQMSTIAAAINIMLSGDVLILGPQAHAEGNLSIPATKTNLTFIGAGNRGACFIEPAVTTDEGLIVLADDFTLINVGVAKGASGDYALKIGDTTTSPGRFRAFGSKFEGDGVAVHLHGCGDIIFDDCEFAWCDKAVLFQSNNNGFCTQIRIKDSLFHNFITAALIHNAAAQQVNNLWVENNFFDEQEDGTAPTDFILLSDNLNIGYIAGNKFAIPTNDAAKLTIGSGILWGPNGTEAGWSTARPA